MLKGKDVSKDKERYLRFLEECKRYLEIQKTTKFRKKKYGAKLRNDQGTPP